MTMPEPELTKKSLSEFMKSNIKTRKKPGKERSPAYYLIIKKLISMEKELQELKNLVNENIK